MTNNLTNIELSNLRFVARSNRVLDIDGPTYRSIVQRIECLDHLDLCFLAAQKINFVSVIAGNVIAARYPNSLHATAI